jgi:hypothetical protein
MEILLPDQHFLKFSPDESMKTKLLFLQLIFLGIVSCPGLCQTSCNCIDLNEINSEPLLSGEIFSPASSPDIVTYFNKNWLTGDIWLTDGSIIRNKKIRYNGLLDELFWLEQESNKTIKLDKEAIVRFHFQNIMGDTSVYFRRLKVKRNILADSTEIYGQEVYQGDLSLFVLHTFYLAGKEEIQLNNSYILKDIYKEDPVYYIKYLNNKVGGFKNFSRKRLYEFLPGKKDQIKRFFKENNPGKMNINPKLIKLMQFLNSIVEQ